MNSFKVLPTTSELIKKYGLDAKKSLGQNFILDKNFTDKIAKSAGDLSNFHVLEIGAGPGSLTRSIIEAGAKKLTIIEKDSRCIKLLQELQDFYGAEKLEIINEDALKFDEENFFADIFSKKQKIKIIANLPYNVGTVLLLKWLKIADKIDSMTLMLQLEVVERIVAKPNENHYGRLAVMVANYASSKKLFEVNRNIFTPPPKVTSAIVEIKPYEKSLFAIDFKKLEKIVFLAFNQRRKMVKSSLKNVEFKDKISLKEAFAIAKIKGEERPENLNLEQFCALANIMV